MLAGGMKAPVGVEVAAGGHGAECEDGFGSALLGDDLPVVVQVILADLVVLGDSEMAE